VKQTRIAAHLGLETLEGKRFHLINTHLSLPTAWAPEFWSHDRKMGFGKNQLAEAKAVAQFAAHAARGEPYLLVGDFNSSPASPVYEFLTKEANLRGAQEVLKQIDPTRPDGFASAGFLRLRMHLDHLFGSKIDFLDLEGTLPFGDARSPFNGLSDHVPLIASFGW
jgi:endonuclease/exonuclease/phosphatase family metal-dependent hydrolase